jgi:glutathione synthase/RimK-type ligase-like ATP-grasp enzyme
MFNQRKFDDYRMSYDIVDGQIGGLLELDDIGHRLDSIGGVFERLMDDRLLPELRAEDSDSPRARRCRALHETLIRWSEVAPALVMNRAGPSATNMSKPFQAQRILGHGFLVPDTLITTDPELVIDFRSKHRRLIYKSISGVRSIVHELVDDDLDRLDRIRWCPTQFQQMVEGTELRVHVVVEEVYAAAIESDAVDYRYAADQVGRSARLRKVALSDNLAGKCVDLARDLGLALAGIDLKVTGEGEVYCFEVNPSPAYSYFEAHTGLPIADAIAGQLARAEREMNP